MFKQPKKPKSRNIRSESAATTIDEDTETNVADNIQKIRSLQATRKPTGIPAAPEDAKPAPIIQPMSANTPLFEDLVLRSAASALDKHVDSVVGKEFKRKYEKKQFSEADDEEKKAERRTEMLIRCVCGSIKWSVSIPEVDLGVETRLKAIEASEKAKSRVLRMQPRQVEKVRLIVAGSHQGGLSGATHAEKKVKIDEK